MEQFHLFSRPDRVIKHRHEDAGRADLYVLTSIFNPIRFRSRWKLYEDWLKRNKETPGVKTYVVEVMFNRRDGVLRNLNVKPDYLLELVTTDEIWLKENALNVLTQHLPVGAQYVYYSDADVRHARDDWANEIVQTLQHYAVIQTWSEMVDLDQNYHQVGFIKSFMSNWKAGLIKRGGDYYAPGRPGYPGAPGLGLAWRREALDAVGGLIDWAIVGACDSYMAWSLIGQLQWALRRDFNPAYTEPMFKWQDRALHYIKRNVGCMPGLAIHFFHGPKAKRGYATREQILAKTKFNPATDLKRDTQGLYQLEQTSPHYEQLRDLLRGYFRQREEDLYA